MNVKLKALTAGVLFFVGGQEALAQKRTVDTAKTADIKEVIVVAFGKQKKEEITGSVTQLKAEAVKDLQNGNVLQGLTGKVGGVQVITSGQPGSDPLIRMRGIGSINSSSAPLIVLDGIPYNGELNSIPGQDIESMTFLKDASSNALYGSRGANGVIMITTKRGKKRGIEVEFDTKVGVNTRAVKDYDIITSPKEYYMAYYDRLRVGAYRGNITSPGSGVSAAAAHEAARTGLSELGYNNYDVAFDQLIVNGQFNPNANLLYQDNWAKNLFKPSMRTEHFFSLSSNGEKVRTYFSGSYLKDNGYALRSGFQRMSSRLNVDYKATENISFGANINYANTNFEPGSRGSGSNYSNAFNFSRGIAPIYPVFARDANYNILYDAKGDRVYDFGTGQFLGQKRAYGSFQNPVGTLNLDQYNDVNDNLSSRFYATAKFLKDFEFTYNFSVDLLNRTYHRLATPLAGDAAPANGRLTRGTDRNLTVGHQQLLTWNRSFGGHSFNVLLGHESNSLRMDNIEGQKTQLLLPDVPSLNYGGNIQYLKSSITDYRVEGYFSRLLYNYDNKYFFNANVRKDGSSVFAPESRWGTFFGLGAAWNVAKENFLADSNVVNTLKLKASYGEQGNDNLLNRRRDARVYYTYLDLYDIQTSGQNTPVPTLSSLGAKNLRWETSQNINAGFESAWFKNRFFLDVEYFERKVSDMLYYLPQPISNTGQYVIPANVGDMKNVGVEANIEVVPVKTENVKWSVFANGTHYKNTVTKLPGAQAKNGIIDGSFKLMEGHSRYDYFMFEFAGVDATNGDALWYKEVTDADGKVTLEKTNLIAQATQRFIGKSAIPKVFGGFGTDLSVGRFNARVNFAYQFGGWGYDAIYQNLLSSSSDIGANYHRDVFNSWTPENPNAAIPRVDRINATQAQASSFYLIKSDYISLQDVTLGYNLSENFLKTFNISSARIYFTGSNLALWSKRRGYDPRMSIMGQSASGQYSVIRTTSVGINVKF
ncbi:SusC/RagA family TonB-linked outer membrane protein [Bergeyella sp. RCAD1439]|uniref:SusC/RagA family TonB-linked outer membrane protein n=1 Tax=Bergeyella anatis TaxID=3113737 RepID=UPI002E19D87A|nr:SusC/RagA family TonB-linked outer membrane protein [Bergeyella sp. RCAD1439]